MPTKNEVQSHIADLAYWQELADLVGWRVMGWTYRRTASYVTDGHYGGHHTDVITLTGRQRDDIVAAIRCTSDDAGNHQGALCPVHEVPSRG